MLAVEDFTMEEPVIHDLVSYLSCSTPQPCKKSFHYLSVNQTPANTCSSFRHDDFTAMQEILSGSSHFKNNDHITTSGGLLNVSENETIETSITSLPHAGMHQQQDLSMQHCDSLNRNTTLHIAPNTHTDQSKSSFSNVPAGSLIDSIKGQNSLCINDSSPQVLINGQHVRNKGHTDAGEDYDGCKLDKISNYLGQSHNVVQTIASSFQEVSTLSSSGPMNSCTVGLLRPPLTSLSCTRNKAGQVAAIEKTHVDESKGESSDNCWLLHNVESSVTSSQNQDGFHMKTAMMVQQQFPLNTDSDINGWESNNSLTINSVNEHTTSEMTLSHTSHLPSTVSSQSAENSCLQSAGNSHPPSSASSSLSTKFHQNMAVSQQCLELDFQGQQSLSSTNNMDTSSLTLADSFQLSHSEPFLSSSEQASPFRSSPDGGSSPLTHPSSSIPADTNTASQSINETVIYSGFSVDNCASIITQCDSASREVMYQTFLSGYGHESLLYSSDIFQERSSSIDVTNQNNLNEKKISDVVSCSSDLSVSATLLCEKNTENHQQGSSNFDFTSAGLDAGDNIHQTFQSLDSDFFHNTTNFPTQSICNGQMITEGGAHSTEMAMDMSISCSNKSGSLTPGNLSEDIHLSNVKAGNVLSKEISDANIIDQCMVSDIFQDSMKYMDTSQIASDVLSTSTSGFANDAGVIPFSNTSLALTVMSTSENTGTHDNKSRSCSDITATNQNNMDVSLTASSHLLHQAHMQIHPQPAVTISRQIHPAATISQLQQQISAAKVPNFLANPQETSPHLYTDYLISSNPSSDIIQDYRETRPAPLTSTAIFKPELATINRPVDQANTTTNIVTQISVNQHECSSSITTKTTCTSVNPQPSSCATNCFQASNSFSQDYEGFDFSAQKIKTSCDFSTIDPATKHDTHHSYSGTSIQSTSLQKGSMISALPFASTDSMNLETNSCTTQKSSMDIDEISSERFPTGQQILNLCASVSKKPHKVASFEDLQKLHDKENLLHLSHSFPQLQSLSMIVSPQKHSPLRQSQPSFHTSGTAVSGCEMCTERDREQNAVSLDLNDSVSSNSGLTFDLNDPVTSHSELTTPLSSSTLYDNNSAQNNNTSQLTLIKHSKNLHVNSETLYNVDNDDGNNENASFNLSAFSKLPSKDEFYLGEKNFSIEILKPLITTDAQTATKSISSHRQTLLTPSSRFSSVFEAKEKKKTFDLSSSRTYKGAAKFHNERSQHYKLSSVRPMRKTTMKRSTAQLFNKHPFVEVQQTSTHEAVRSASMNPVQPTSSRQNEVSLKGHYPSKADGMELRFLEQPEIHHRARYQTEGSRGAIKDMSQQGFPTIKLFGCNKPTKLHIFIGNEYGRVKPHGFYQACRVLGKNSTPCLEHDVEGTTVVEVDLLPENGMTARLDCVGILKLRNSDVERRIGVKRAREKKKTSIRARLVARCLVEKSAKCLHVLQVASRPILCTQPIGQPEISRMSLTESSFTGGQSLFIFGKNFRNKGTHVLFQELDSSNETVVWQVKAEVEQEFFQPTHLICKVPPYKDPGVDQPQIVQIVVTSSGKQSEPQKFTYKPGYLKMH